MRTIQIRTLSIAALAFLAFAGSAPAQDTSPAILNALEVRQLVAHAQPVDQARLSAHFAALADRYTAEAKRHRSMSQGFIGNPSRNLAAGTSAHCTRLAELNTQSATALRELAAHHKNLAAGEPSTAPSAGAHFEAGAGAPAPGDRDLSRLAETARTPADHRQLETYFLTLAERYGKDIADHTAIARAYRSLPRDAAGGTQAAHCDRLVALSREAAKEAKAAAAVHEELARTER